MTASGRAGARMVSTLWTVNAQCQRLPSLRTVADKIRAVPASRRRASLRVDSCVLIRPTRGRVTWRRSDSTWIAPVVNLTEGTVRRRERNRGKPARRPSRLTFLETAQLSSARATPSSPVLNASLEHSDHQGATIGLAVFQARRNAGRFHPRAGVSSCSLTP
jgi:hypothetical protein